MNTYTFRINSVDAKVNHEDLTNVITRVHYTHIVSNADGVMVSANNVIALPEPDPETFVPSDQLVQADIIEWIKQVIDVEATQANLDARLAEKVAPTIIRLDIPESLDAPTEEPIV